MLNFHQFSQATNVKMPIMLKISQYSHLTLHNVGFGTRKIFCSEKFVQNSKILDPLLRGHLRSADLTPRKGNNL